MNESRVQFLGPPDTLKLAFSECLCDKCNAPAEHVKKKFVPEKESIVYHHKHGWTTWGTPGHDMSSYNGDPDYTKVITKTIEHIKKTCTSCGFFWYERPADYDSNIDLEAKALGEESIKKLTTTNKFNIDDTVRIIKGRLKNDIGKVNGIVKTIGNSIIYDVPLEGEGFTFNEDALELIVDINKHNICKVCKETIPHCTCVEVANTL